MNLEPTLLAHLLDDAAARRPDRPAVTSGGTTLTHAELSAASHRLARWLADRGLRRGDRVVVVAGPTPLTPALLYATARVGAVFTLLHEQVRGRPLTHVLDDFEPALVVGTDPAVLDAVRAGGIDAVDAAALAETAFTGAPTPWAAPAGQEPLPVDPVCLIYTSGTTSLPKAVVTTHQQAVFAVRAIHSQLSYQDDDVVYSPLPLSFDYGLYQLFLGAVSGAHVRLGQPVEAGPALARNLVRAGATVLAAVPAVAEALARLLSRGGPAPALRLLTSTGAAMPAEALVALRAAIPGLRVQLMFGLTECKRATIMPPDEDLLRPGSCGRALPGTEVFVVAGSGRRLPPGEVGEIVVRGPNVMAGYWRRPELTEQRFPKADGLFPQLRTGDYGWVDEEGYLYFSGRRDDIYKERGFRVSATEVEAAARRVPGCASAAVLPGNGEPAALVATGTLTAEQLLADMREQIEEFKIPRRCVIIDELPLTRNGKVDRTGLASLLKEARHV
ncbi:acyl--CoA ligase [Amycolatopsis sp. OK19-0408]|uniref:Acyl--CoA ligase n=1 Tax=Amycolatopsis iheyensis TaxID=2945988 RepID=A0A9X2SJ03_9PSEU|nr:class I adenylate-forming enzyme family protein [Amycolatopsis iheyensis]MCR6483503.1 acyl--CoA ligase [Amycolatopsis iheyensis]